MDTPPPIPAELPPPLPGEAPPARFRLGLAPWIAVGLYVAIRVGLVLVEPAPLTARHAGEVTGEMTVMIGLPMIAALFFWRIGGRSRIAGTVGFFGVFALFQLSQLTTHGRRRAAATTEATAELDRIRRDRDADNAKQLRALQEGKELDNKASAELAQRTRAQLEKIAQNTTGSDSRMVLGSKIYLDRINEAKNAYGQALGKLDPENWWKLAQLDDPEKIDARRLIARAFMEANTQLADAQDINSPSLRRILTQRGLSAAEIEQFIRATSQALQGRLPHLLKVRECDTQLGEIMLAFLDFADAQRGKWTLNASGEIVFPDNVARKTYADFLARTQEIAAEQTEAQKQLLGGKPSPGLAPKKSSPSSR
jgi:hypothetical protein